MSEVAMALKEVRVLSEIVFQTFWNGNEKSESAIRNCVGTCKVVFATAYQ